MSDVALGHMYIPLPLKCQHASLPCATLDSNCSFERLKYDKQFTPSVQGQMACKLQQAQGSWLFSLGTIYMQKNCALAETVQ